jgi:hypothetical protein
MQSARTMCTMTTGPSRPFGYCATQSAAAWPCWQREDGARIILQDARTRPPNPVPPQCTARSRRYQGRTSRAMSGAGDAVLFETGGGNARTLQLGRPIGGGRKTATAGDPIAFLRLCNLRFSSLPVGFRLGALVTPTTGFPTLALAAGRRLWGLVSRVAAAPSVEFADAR